MAEKKGTGESSKKAARSYSRYIRDPVFACLAVLCLLLAMTTVYFASDSNQKAPSPTGAAVAATVDESPKSEVDVDALESKVEKYLQDNLLAGSGITLDIKDSNEVDGVYNMSVELIQDGQTQDGGSIFVAGNAIILPQMVLDLDTPLQQPEQPAAQPEEVPKSDKPLVELFIMSFCPYGVRAASAMNPVAGLLGGKADITVGYVLYSNYASQRGADWSQYCSDESESYCSMHGVGELNEDVRELCIQKHQPDNFWAYMAEVAKAYNAGEVSASNIDEKWKGFAQTADVDIAEVESCVAAEKETLLAEQAALNDLYGVQGSPTMIVNGAEASFSRSPEGFKTGICGAFNTAPGECSQTLSSTGAAAAGNC